jgi:hypothetical protein
LLWVPRYKIEKGGVEFHLFFQDRMNPVQAGITQETHAELERLVERKQAVNGGLGENADLVLQSDQGRYQRQQFLTC